MTDISVATDIDNKQQFKVCFTVSGVKLPVGYFLGVSAATGDLSDTHDIISLKMFDLSTPDDVSLSLMFSFIIRAIKIYKGRCQKQHL